MAGIRLHVIAPLVLVAVGKCARDPSVYVRKCAANSLPKLHDLHLEEVLTTIEETIGILLNDNSPGVVGAAAAAFSSVCPNNLSLVGRNYRKLCETLPDVEEWGQIILMEILLRYLIAKHGLVKESIMFSSCSTENVKDDSDGNSVYKENSDDAGDGLFRSELEMVAKSYLEGPEKYLSRSDYRDNNSFLMDISHFTSAKDNDDVKILLHSTTPLLWSQNSAVVLAAAGLHWIMAPMEDVKRIVKPLLFVLRSSSASRYVVLGNILVFAKSMPSLFAPYFEDFFVTSSDPYQIKALKLEILSLIATYSTFSTILQEFQDYIRDPNRRFAADTVATIGLCAQRLPNVAALCLEGLLALTGQESQNNEMDGEGCVLVQALASIKQIINLDPPSHEKVVIQLVRSLDTIKVPQARAMITWMAGEYSSVGSFIPRALMTVLQYLAWCFPSESLEMKLQILNTAAKVQVNAEDEDIRTHNKILSYVLELAKYDSSYDVRDRARVLKKLLPCNVSSDYMKEEANYLPHNRSVQLAECLFKRGAKQQAKPNDGRFYLPGSLSHLVLHAAPGYEPLPSPCSLVSGDLAHDSNHVHVEARGGATDSDLYEYGLDRSDEESISGSQDIATDSDGSDNSYSMSDSEIEDGAEPLIHLSDTGNANLNHGGSGEDSLMGLDNFGKLMSGKALESWLDDNPSQSSSQVRQAGGYSARILMGDLGSKVKPKTYTLLDAANGNGLNIDYTFSSEISSISKLLVCIEVSFTNRSTESMFKLSLHEEESNKGLESAEGASGTSERDVPTLVPMEEIDSLEVGQTIKRVIQVQFHHHLLPLKLVLWYNSQKQSVKLRPDIGYFVKPFPMDGKIFTNKESQLPGMFEYIRSCTFNDHIVELNNEETGPSSKDKDKFLVISESIALKILSNANLFLVSVDMPVAGNLEDASGLCLRFSGEILSSSTLCLISLTVGGKCCEPLTISVKINCEETVFGLNLLNRIINFLAEPPTMRS
ncbi:AP3-complex subunit beta-A isoform X2 [Impatiens glandulifera]|nr:AP3-complex subunit beta-A isoform X2 [Impatiens glandulifera]